MKSKDQILLEQAYLKVNEAHPHANPETRWKPSSEPSLASIKKQEREFQNQERNAGEEETSEEPQTPKSKPSSKVGTIKDDPKTGKSYIWVNTGMGPMMVARFGKIKDQVDGVWYEIPYEIKRVDEEGKAVKDLDLDKKRKLMQWEEPTQYGVKGVPGVPGFDD